VSGRQDTLLYVYAVVEGAPAELGRGLDGAPLRAVTSGQVAAVVSEHERAPEPAEKTLWQHEDVAERLLEVGAVLPMRFGATVAGTKQLKALLRTRQDEFLGLIAMVRGAVELSVRAELPAPDSDRDTGGDAATEQSGTEYMRHRGRALRSVDRAKERLHQPLKDLARRALVLEPRGAGWERAFRGAYLVDGERVETFAARVDGLAEELGAEVSCTGPWPPYSFVVGDAR
jgi:Gas vesicle synthesis protein GvpL/GvpF